MADEKTYSKEAFLKSSEYKEKRDLLDALLENGKSYTKKHAERLVENYLKGKVIR